MADWLVLENWKGRIGNQDVRVLAGTVIDDTQEPVTTMLANGAALVPDNAAYNTARTRWNEAYDPTDPADAGETMMAVMMANGVAPGGGITPRGGELFVDGSFTGTSTGSRDNPAKTYAAAAALASAGDVIKIFPGTYAEDLATVAGVDVWGLCQPKSGRVLFTGQLTAAHAGTCNILNVAFTEAGAGASALEVTGAVATVLNLSGCLFTAGALADYAFLLNAAASVVRIEECVFTTITANANETFQLIAGTLHVESAYVTHADGITGPTSAVVETGAGVLSVTWNNVRIQGNVVPTTGAQNPTNTFTNCRIETGANSGIQTSSTNACTVYHSEIVSADAGGFAVDGAGVFVHSGLKLTGTATNLAAALNAAAGPDSEVAWERPLTNALFVDPNYAGGRSNGSPRHPYATIVAAQTVAVAGQVIMLVPETYAEDLALAAGVDIIGLCPPRSERVIIEGLITAAYNGFATLQNLYITEDTVATIAVTGANPTYLNLRSCVIEAQATSTFAIDMDAAAATVVPWDTIIRTLTGNANQTVLVSAGNFWGEQIAIMHADGVTGPAVALEADGTGVADVILYDFQIQGGVNVVSAAQNPTTTFGRGRIEVGALAGIYTDSTGACHIGSIEIVSAEADGFAIDGDGVLEYTGVRLSGAAQVISPSLNAGAGAGADDGAGSVITSGGVAVAQIIQAGQPVATETLTVGADVYEADGVGGNINFVIAGSAAATLTNLLNAAIANGTEPLFWDAINATTLRLRSADGPQGNIMAADPNIALTEAMTNYVFDCGNVNMNTLGGHRAAPIQEDVQTITVNAGHAASGSLRFSFPFAVTNFIADARTAAGLRVAIVADTFAIDNGDVLVVLGGGGLVATDVITVRAWG